MRKNDVIYLKHILDAISRIEEYVKGVKREDYMRNNLLQDGVIRQIEIMGEAAKRLSSEIKEKYPNLPWKDMAGMRDIPLLKREVKKIIKREKN